MANSSVQTLQIAVRRRLWRGQFVAATRLALWGSAGLMLFAVAVHLAARAVRVDIVVLAIVALCSAVMAWAALRRPSDSACALWADRNLGGASAFSTLLEMREGKQPAPDTPALQWLEHWAATRVPHSLRLLGGRRDAARLSRPLLSVLVCAGLATIVLALPGTAPSAPRPLAAPSASQVADRPIPGAERPVSRELVSALAGELRSTESRRASGRDDSRGPTTGAGKSDASTAFAHGSAWRRAAGRTDHASAVRFLAPSMMPPPRPRQHRLPAPAPAATPATAATIAPMLAFRGSRGVRSRCKDVNRTNGVHRWKGRPTRISRRCSTTIFRCIARRRSGRIPPSPRRHLLRPQTPLRSLRPGLPTYKHG